MSCIVCGYLQVYLHPSSVNYSVTYFKSPYLVYQEKLKTSRVYIRDCSMVPVLPLILFSGSGLKVELHQGTFVIALEDGWIKFAVDSHEVRYASEPGEMCYST